ncbi:MAG: uncharacterized protein QOI88_4573 [Gammaproteobacteria bacterium]|jgi:uncharacterized protein YyaL (SSP411 family)|nr:uncharacterized protein [Gammaproteobacteria bacterium]
MQRNRLELETSPYLLQHADNPVDWYPWGEEALALAKRENKPILLSVGYSACHWCHVMAHESFEDPEIAARMNRWFVNIKVDREERPDLDRIYQLAQQLITQRNGGWPLTMFLTPGDQQPFFGGTYFPNVGRHGLPGFGDLLARVAEYFRDHEDDIRRQNAQLALAFERLMPAPPPADVVLGAAPLDAARRTLEESFDSRWGGFGRAPKFPHPNSVERCLRHWHATSSGTGPDLKALYMATLTLTRMADGGLYDQLGGGFARYSVDDFWMIPHFEKMLYDNAQLLHAYACAALATGETRFARVAGETADWILRDMHSLQGGFYSSLDADSEGHEGKFYAWTRAEVQGWLTPAEYAAFARRFGLDRDANFEGQWHLHVCEPPEQIDASNGSVSAMIDSARAKLLAARNQRIWPARDEKVLTSWNALTIKGLAAAGRVLQRPDLTDAASAAVDFIRHTLWREGRLLATYKDGRAHLPAYLDDYAFLADALLELLQSRWRSSDLEFARELLGVLLAKFEDSENGGFYFTASDHDRLIHRSKTFSDDSLPSGNGVAASVLCRLGYLVGEPRYLDAAERTLKAASALMLEYPQAHMSLLNALQDFLAPMQVVIIRGSAAESAHWARELSAVYAPTRMVFAIPGDVPDLPAALAAKPAVGGVTAYVCTGMTCAAPLTDLSELALRCAV